ncbi:MULTISPECIES: IS5 family transposase [Frankia]|uniref:Transposase (Partial) n=1 Tax=Frankia alni (strain DSM 45986 / CECT 9034 / ACN14a) TaxID=326424 RepID=Q0RMF6_FRAAA|nr:MULTISPECIES: IS5 family transposase [Frankia]CAJ61295.1 Putative transposase (partial) [Frankia alni ACN14a]
MPEDAPPDGGAPHYFARWHDQGVTERVHDALRDQLRVQEGRDTDPTAGIIDSQSVKGADTVPAASCGFDMGKRVDGHKRFLVVETLGLLLAVLVVPASTHDTAGGRQVLLDSYFAGRRLQLVFGDGMFAGTIVDWAAHPLGLRVQVVRRPAGQKGFKLWPRRWVVERTLAWITAHRRHARDYERRPDHAEALIRWAMIGVMARRIDRRAPARWSGPRPLQRII